MATPTDTAGTGEPGLERTTSTTATPGFAGRTELTVAVDLDHPIWTIQHVAAALHASVDTAREYTYRDDFPTRSKPYYRLKYRDVHGTDADTSAGRTLEAARAKATVEAIRLGMAAGPPVGDPARGPRRRLLDRGTNRDGTPMKKNQRTQVRKNLKRCLRG